MKEQVLEKLKKLIRRGTSENEHESQLAMMKAQEICLLNGIEISQIDAFDEQKIEEKYIKGEVDCGQRFGICQRFVNWILSHHFNVKIIQSGGRHDGRQIIFIGKTSDVEFAKWLNDYLNETFLRLWHDYKNRTGAETRLRESYIYGLYTGLNDKLKENKTEVVEKKIEQIKLTEGVEKAEEVSNSYAIVLRNDAAKMEDAVSSFFPSLRRGGSYRPKGRNHDTVNAGYATGRKINTNKVIL